MPLKDQAIPRPGPRLARRSQFGRDPNLGAPRVCPAWVHSGDQILLGRPGGLTVKARPPRPRPRSGRREEGAHPGSTAREWRGRRARRRKRARRARPATLTCRRPRAWDAASRVVVTLARASAHHRPVPGRCRHRRGSCGTRAAFSGSRAGTRRAWAAENPTLVASRRCRCAPRGCGAAWQGLQAASDAEEALRVGGGEAKRAAGGCAAAGRTSEGWVVRRGLGGEGAGPVVSQSHPDPSATILGGTLISRPRRQTGGRAGRAEYPGRQRAPPGRARASSRDARSRGRTERTRRAPRSAPPPASSPPSGFPSPPAQGRLGRGDEGSRLGRTHRGRPPS
ncbi:serine/arginine repetitive matrix protein 2-like [Heterocephalus glaber]|uniref:Serine/arginine repetitive matrix protein 2-like n=1 Tax=Heterocephalus glaber TaxID=10181 RepID=A0AAX6SCR0_HETGA|nr:serine/arginine repetitive matrix protein 2-like [Heterocephalus glaber]